MFKIRIQISKWFLFQVHGYPGGVMGVKLTSWSLEILIKLTFLSYTIKIKFKVFKIRVQKSFCPPLIVKGHPWQSLGRRK
jgi:hypothetical protein